MNAITPANEIPPAQSTAARGTLPTEHTNESTATIGPINTFSSSCPVPPVSERKSPLKKSIGSSATKPAIRKPAPISFQSISQSLRKLSATSVHASSENSFGPPPAAGCTCPVSAAIACSRASSSAPRETSSRIAIHISTIRISPPTNSASVNCQPMKTQITIPISKTRFVEANCRAIAAARLAPF